MKTAAVLFAIFSSLVLGGDHDDWQDPVVSSFYAVWSDGAWKDLANAVFSPKAIYEHTGEPSAQGPSEIKALFKRLGKLSSTNYRVVDVQQASKHKVVIVFRDGFRDKLIIDGDRIKLAMTVKADPNDQNLPAVKEAVQHAPNKIFNAKMDRMAVQEAVDYYFNGFMGLRGDQMADAFVQEGLYMMYDLNAERKVPFACSMSQDCGTAPFMSTQEVLRQATAGFTNGFIKLNHKFTKVKLLGSELAYATTITFGCEGDAVTPPGTKPMPNRELFVLVKTPQNGWKIKSYFFTYDPASPLKPPVPECTETKTQTSERIIQKFLANTGNPDVLRSIMSPTLTYVSLNFRNDNLTQIMPWAGSHPNDGEALITTFADVSRFWRIDEFNAVDIIAQGEKVAVFGNFTYTSTVLQKTVTSPFAINAKLSEGKLVYMMFMEDTLMTSQSFWKSGQRTYVSDPDTLEEVVF